MKHAPVTKINQRHVTYADTVSCLCVMSADGYTSSCLCVMSADGYTSSCLCVLCGVPAVGKSRLAEMLRDRAQSRGWETLLVTYDELIPPRDWQETEWKQHRKTVLMCLERFLHETHTDSDQTNTDTHTEHDIWMKLKQKYRQQRQSSSQTRSESQSQSLLVLLDDNFYYQSMRYQIYQLARKYSMGFCQVFLQCPLNVCLQRNQQRFLCVPDEVLLQMSERMEPPNKSRSPWEQQSLTVDTTDSLTDKDVLKMMDFLESALENPLSPIQDNSQQKEIDRQICASNVLHQADQTCRRLISQAMTSVCENRPSSVLKVFAKELNGLKTHFLQELKKDVFHQMSVCPEKPINTEKVLMTAAGAFEQITQERVETLTRQHRVLSHS